MREATWVACVMNASGNFKEAVTAETLVKGKGNAAALDLERIRQRAEDRKRERLAGRAKRE